MDENVNKKLEIERYITKVASTYFFLYWEKNSNVMEK